MKVNEWSIKPLGEIAQLIMGQSPDSQFYSDEVIGMPFLQGCAEFQSRFPKHVQYCSQIKKQAPAGSILFSVRTPVGKINIADQNYIIGRGLAAILADSVIQEYLEQYLIFEESKFRNASQGSTFESINSSELSGWHIQYPDSKPEQSKIAEILSTVDKAIEQTEALIAKQQHIKTGLMQDLLTKGIDENGNLRSEKTHKFKDSPLGRIPEEWDCCQFGEFIELLTDYHANGSYERLKEKVNLLSEPNYAVMIRTLNLEKNDFDDLIFITQEAYEFLKKSYVNPGDLLMNKIANAGAIYLMPDLRCPVSTGMNLFLIRTDQRILFQEFAYYFLCLHQPYVRSFAKGTTTKTITKNAVKNLFIHKPNIKEQEVIIFLIRTQCHIILTLCNNFKKLQSIKTALMQDLLTGKVRVTPLLNNEVENE